MTVTYTGRKFGRLTVLGIRSESKTSKGFTYNCVCECGLEKVCKHFDLKHRRATSCGCARFMPRVSKAHRAAVILLAKYRNKAKIRGLVFELTSKEFEGIVTSDCHYCGEKPRLVAGVDRKDSNTGYVLDNCLPCCGICNFAKSDMPYEDFIDWVRRAYCHSIGLRVMSTTGTATH